MTNYIFPSEKSKRALNRLKASGVEHPLHKKGFLVDVDGVICRGKQLIEGADEVIQVLRDAGKGVVFVSNNSTKSPSLYQEKLRNLGIEVRKDKLVLATVATADFICSRTPEARVFVVGDSGLVETMEEYDLATTDVPGKADYVVVGNPFRRDGKLREGNDGKIAGAVKAILENGAKFIAVNQDTIFPTEQGPVPATGAVVKAIEHATGGSPDLVAGKPRGHITSMGLDKLGYKSTECALIGDSKVDMHAANKAEIQSVFVRSGGTKEKELTEDGIYPDFTLDSIKNLMGVSFPNRLEG